MSHEERKTNGTKHDRVPEMPWWVVPVLAICVGCLLAAGISTWLSLQSASDASDAAKDASTAVAEARRVELKDRNVARTTAYRLCTRNKVDRAFAHSAVGARSSIALEDKTALPILNCKPNLKGLGARVLPPERQRNFVRRWERGELTPQQLGVCPGVNFNDPNAATDC